MDGVLVKAVAELSREHETLTALLTQLDTERTLAESAYQKCRERIRHIGCAVQYLTNVINDDTPEVPL